MTINKNKNKIIYTGNGLLTEYEYDFKIPKKINCVVYKINIAGDQAILVQDIDYAVSGIGLDEGGIITLTTPLEDQYKLLIYRQSDFLQETDLTNQESYFLETIEDTFDILTTQTQELYENSARSIQLPISEDGPFILPEGDRENKVFGFNDQGEPEYFTPSEYVVPATELTDGIVRYATQLESDSFTSNGVLRSEILGNTLNKKLIQNYKNNIDYDPLGITGPSFSIGSDGEIYKCLIANGPSSSVVDPVGDVTGTWVLKGQVKTVKIIVSGTYNPPAGVISLEFVPIGAGGGGGGADGQGAGTCACAGGGGAGGSSIKTTTDIEASYIITIGAGGIGGTGSGDGGAGGDTIIASTFVNITASGGFGGEGMIGVGTNKTANGGIGGASIGGDVDSNGADGSSGLVVSGERASLGDGGSSILGGGPRGTGASSGRDGAAYGAGGSGAGSLDLTTNFNGGNGADGIVIIKEYY